MKTIKGHKRWPNEKEVLQKRLKKICREIDSLLENDFPASVLSEDSCQALYRKKFTELFKLVNYPYDSAPFVDFEHRMHHLGGINIIFKIKDKNGEVLLC